MKNGALMKPGQIFELPNDYMYPPGHIGRILDRETNKTVIAKYEVVEVEGALKGRVLVTYGNKRIRKAI